MSFKFTRDWYTPLTIGSFLLLTVTGVLMFFHLDTGLNKTAHEWLSWILVLAVVGHVGANFFAFKRHFQARRAQYLIGACVLVLVASFFSFGGQGGGQPPFIAPVKALAAAPLPVLAQVGKVDIGVIKARLASAGAPAPGSDAATVAELVGPDLRRQMEVLGQVLATPAAAAGH